MQVAIGLVFHESNTFFSVPMTMEKFREKDLHFGADIPAHWTGTATEMGGFLEGARHHAFKVIPTLAAWGMPAGPLTAETFEELSTSLVSRLKDAGRLDGVLLSLHGAMVAEGYPDADGELLRRVRQAIGPATPLVVTLDYHANVTVEMINWPDAMLGYDTYPHIDQQERGLEAATILQQMLQNGLHPKLAFVRRPLLPHILCQLTDEAPMSEAIAMAHELEQDPEILSISVAAGFPYCDVPDAGLTVYAVARHDVGAAERAAEQIAEFVWSRRGEFQKSLPDARAAVHQSIEVSKGLTLLADVGDNLGAGTPGDGTVILAELLKQNAQDALVLLCDPEAVAEAVNAGVRGRVHLKVGGKTDREHGDPIEIDGTVLTLSDGLFKNIGPMRDGIVDDQGRTAVIRAAGVLVVVTERRMPMWNLEQLRSLGIEPTRLRIIVVKSAIAYRAAYLPIADRVLEVDTPGLAAADIRRYTYHHLRRPIYPLDPL